MSVVIDEHPQPTPAVLDEAALLSVARQLASEEARWRAHVVHDSAQRRPVRLVVTDSYEAWVIGWTEGQRVDLHDHGDAAGALVVAEGTLDCIESSPRTSRSRSPPRRSWSTSARSPIEPARASYPAP